MEFRYIASEVLLHPATLTLVFLAGFTFVFLYVINSFRYGRDSGTKHEKISVRHAEKKKVISNASSTKSKKKGADNKWLNREKQAFSHPWLLTSFKGHTGQVLDMDFSSNGKYLATCGDDRTVFLWDCKDLGKKGHKSLRVNVEFDYANFVKWSPDSKAFLIHKFNQNAVEVFKVEKKKDGSLGHTTKALTFPKVHEDDVVGMSISSNGKFIMTCSNKNDLAIWDLRGQILEKLDTYLINTTCAKVSPCGKFVVASGFAPDAKVWEVVFAKDGTLQEVKRAFELTGHSSGIFDVAFDVDSSHMATVSKDGTWRLYDTKINYKQGQSPYLKRNASFKLLGASALVALSPNAEVLAVASADCIQIFNTLSGELDNTIENIYEGEVTCLMFDASGDFLLAGGERQVHVFHNIPGYKCKIESAKEKLKENQTSATKERLQQIILDSEKFLETVQVK